MSSSATRVSDPVAARIGTASSKRPRARSVTTRSGRRLERSTSTPTTTAAANDRLGMLMSWVNGACSASHPRLKKKHLRHHSDRLDVVTFDYRAALHQAPAWVRCSVLPVAGELSPASRGARVGGELRFGVGHRKSGGRLPGCGRRLIPDCGLAAIGDGRAQQAQARFHLLRRHCRILGWQQASAAGFEDSQ